VPRDELLEILWPDQDFVHATVSLNSLTYNLQRRLRHQCGGVSPLICANGYYSLNKDAGISTDIAKFDAQVFRGARQSAIGNELEAKRAYELAVGFYGGDLCTGSNVFSVIERERLRASFLSVLAWLADHAYRDQDNEAALHYALLLLKCDPCREDAHRLVMRIRVQRGERAEALRHYRVCEQALRQEFDAAPEALTHELFELIRAGSGQG
jgi:DNA-binding SARP family transcriptional activator